MQVWVFVLEAHVMMKADSLSRAAQNQNWRKLSNKTLQMQEIFPHSYWQNSLSVDSLGTTHMGNDTLVWPVEDQFMSFWGVSGSATFLFKHCTFCASQME